MHCETSKPSDMSFSEQMALSKEEASHALLDGGTKRILTEHSARIIILDLEQIHQGLTF